MTEAPSTRTDCDALRDASVCRQLSLLAQGRTSSAALTRAYLDAAEASAPGAAWVHRNAESALQEAEASDRRRGEGKAIGRLEGIPLAIQDSIDVAGMPCSAGLAARAGQRAERDAFAVARLRGAGAVLLGKTHMDEAALGALGRHPRWGNLDNPLCPGHSSGGASSGAAVTVAAGLASAAVGVDTLGSARIPASFCGIYALRPTLGEISTAGSWPALPRLDTIAPMARSLDDLTLLLQVMRGHDPADPRSRRRRVPLLAPDWEPSALRCGIVDDLEALGVSAPVSKAYADALDCAGGALGQRRSTSLAPLELGASRRRALLMMEAQIGVHAAAWLDGASDALLRMIDFARGRDALDYAAADLALDAAVVATRGLFERIDVLILPTAPELPPAHADPEPSHLTDLCAFASLAGCPALALPLVGPPGSDLRLLELGEILAALLDCAC